MRILILMMLVFASCNKIVSPNLEQNTVEETISNVDICDTDFQEFLEDSLKYLDIPDWSNYVVIERDDQFIEKLKTDYIDCIKGKTENEIIELFGSPRGNKKDYEKLGMIYDCAPKDYHETKRGEMCLIFKFNEDNLVKHISYYKCWDVID